MPTTSISFTSGLFWPMDFKKKVLFLPPPFISCGQMLVFIFSCFCSDLPYSFVDFNTLIVLSVSVSMHVVIKAFTVICRF